MKLDLGSFEKALASLERAIRRSSAEVNDEELRDAVIQRFEYTYELSWKMLKRRLEQDSPSPQQIDRLSFNDLLREAAERGMITNVRRWMEFREQRNITSHTYDRKKAESVYATALDFAKEAGELLAKLQERNHD